MSFSVVLFRFVLFFVGDGVGVGDRSPAPTMASMTMMGSTMKGNAQTITSLGGVLPTPASPSKTATGEVRD